MKNRLEEAITVVTALESWLEATREPGQDGPYASVHLCVGNGVLEITIGHICVFCCQSDNSEDLNFKCCRDKFLSEIEQYAPFLSEERTAS